MMTLYVIFDALDRGLLRLHDTITVSERAAAEVGSRLGLTAGQDLTIHEAINGLIVVSGNDVAVAVAEHVGPTLEEFVGRMNERAQHLELKGTTFVNPSGYPAPGQMTNARDMATLGFRLSTDFPGYRPWLAQSSMVFDGRRRYSTNGLLTEYHGMDGIKTGSLGSLRHLVASAVREDRRLIGVVMGCRERGQREAEMTKLLDYGFSGTTPFGDSN
jgi:D-alanyl-D-alanine carboxypeptidase